VPKRERVDLGAIPITTTQRTLIDCVAAHVSPELTEQAVRQARTRRLIDKDELKRLRTWLAPYARMAQQNELPWADLEALTAALKAFLNPVLSGTAEAAWRPAAWRWEPSGVETESSDPWRKNRLGRSL
jgi:hypothetical protein